MARKHGAAMRGDMTNLSSRWATPGRLAVLPLAGLVAALAAREPLGIQADPLRVIGAFLAGTLVLVLAARYPAAFAAPVLFLPRFKEVSRPSSALASVTTCLSVGQTESAFAPEPASHSRLTTLPMKARRPFLRFRWWSWIRRSWRDAMAPIDLHKCSSRP